MRTRLVTFVVALTFAGHAHAALWAGITIRDVLVDPQDAQHVAVLLDGAPIEAAESFDGAKTFIAAKADALSALLTSGQSSGGNRYVSAGMPFTKRWLLRSGDQGATWEESGLRDLLFDEVNKDMERQKSAFRAEYGGRMPARSPLWVPSVIAYSVAFLAWAAFLLRSMGLWRVCWSLGKSVFVLTVVFLNLIMFSDILTCWVNPVAQWPARYFQSGAAANPSAKLGILLNVAALPIPLLCFFLCIVPILPSTIDVICDRRKCRVGDELRLRAVCSIIAVLLWTFLAVATISPWPFGYFWE